MGLEMQNSAAETKLRAERRAGEMLGRMEKAKGAAKKGWKTRSRDVTALSELGIQKKQSERWQQIAALPKKDFEGYIREHNQGGEGFPSQFSRPSGISLRGPCVRFYFA